MVTLPEKISFVYWGGNSVLVGGLVVFFRIFWRLDAGCWMGDSEWNGMGIGNIVRRCTQHRGFLV